MSAEPMAFCRRCRACTVLAGRCVVCGYNLSVSINRAFVTTPGSRRSAQAAVRETEAQVRSRLRWHRVRRWLEWHLVELLAGCAAVAVCIYAAVAWWVW